MKKLACGGVGLRLLIRLFSEEGPFSCRCCVACVCQGERLNLASRSRIIFRVWKHASFNTWMVSGLADGPYYLQSTLQTSNQLDDLRRIRMSPNRQQRMTARIPRSWQLGIVVVLDKSPIRHMDWWTIPAEALARSSTGRLLFSDLCMRSTLVEGVCQGEFLIGLCI